MLDSETLLKILQQQRENGAVAEEFVLSCEKKRLLNLGREDLSRMVKKISDVNVSAGYDILSYNGITSEEYDRFIEVKSTSSDEVAFFISKNELETAKILQNNYWIYHIKNVSNKFLREIAMKLNNPYELFEETDDFEIEPVLWRVRLISKKNRMGTRSYYKEIKHE